MERLPLTVVSLFDGIGGFCLAFERAGAEVVATVEIDKDAAAIGHRHFPQATQFDDVTKVSGDDLRAAGFVPDRGVVTAGWPCQDFSVAGRRAGLAGARSGLWWHVVRVLAETRPRWFIGENVPGLLSSACQCPGDGTCVTNGHRDACAGEAHDVKPGGCCVGGCMETHGGAMGSVLGSLGELGYGVAYRVLDAQHFGVPQQRRRVFIVGHLGAPFGAPAQVLLEPEGGDGDSAPCGTSGPVAAGVAEGSAGAAGASVIHTRAVHENQRGEITTPDVMGTLKTGGGKPGQGCPCIVQPLALRGREGGAQLEIGPEGGPYNALRAGDGGSSRQSLIAVTSLDLRNAARESSSGAGTQGDGWREGGPSYGLSATARAIPGVATETIVRRLTELECERLQGYPDDWTEDQKGSPRYRQLGNSVAVPVVEWIARRTVFIDQAMWN